MKTKTIFQKTAVIFTMFVFIVFAFSACSSDDGDDPDPTPVDQVVGTWNVVSLVSEGSGSVSGWGVTIRADYNGVGSNLNCNLVITENPNKITSNGTFDMTLSITYTPDDYTNDLGLPRTKNLTTLPFVADGTWSRSGSNLIYTIDEEDVVAGTIIHNENEEKLIITFSQPYGLGNLFYSITFARKVEI